MMASNSSCSADPPYGWQVMSDGDASNVAILVISGVCVCVTLGVYVEQVIYIKRHWWSWRIRDHKLCLLGIYPVFGFLALLGIIIPRSTLLVDLVSSVYLSACIVVFLRLMICYYGGTTLMIKSLSEHVLVLRSPPCCCCLCCLPKIQLTQKVLWRINIMVFQLVLIRPVLMMLAAVMWTDGIYVPGKIAADEPYIYIQSINNISTFTAMYGLVLIFRISRVPLKDYFIISKFITLQLVILFSNLQSTVINLIEKSGAIPCTPPFGSVVSGERIHHFMLVIEMMLVSFLAMWSYRREIPSPDLENPDNENKELLLASDDSTCKHSYTDPALVIARQ